MHEIVADVPLHADPKRERILEGAKKVFLTYGFARTTMDDIARAADMSRPALYLLFRNKSEIFRAVVARTLDDSIGKADRALSSSAPFGARLVRMIDDCLLAMMRSVAASPHGSEILDLKSSLAGDLAADWRSRLADRLQRAIAEEAERAGTRLAERGLSARALAEMLLDGLQGLKVRTPDPDRLREGAIGQITVLEIVLQSGR